MSSEIIEADDDGTPEDTCRNGRLACAGPNAYDLSSESHVPICADCARQAISTGDGQ